jgi:hypothetical protein
MTEGCRILMCYFVDFFLVASGGRGRVVKGSYFIQNHRKNSQFEVRHITYFEFVLKCLAIQECVCSCLSRRRNRRCYRKHKRMSIAVSVMSSFQDKAQSIVKTDAFQSIVNGQGNFSI